MGFLSGAYGKLMAGKLVRSIQYEMTRVQSQLRRTTRDIANMEKMFSAQERSLKARMQSDMQNSIWGYAGKLGVNPNDPKSMMNMYQTEQGQEFLNAFSVYQQRQQAQFTMAQSMWQNNFEMMREAQLEPLKDLEDELQTRKDNLDSRLKLAQQEYDAKKEEEKAGAKNIAPDYTGQG